MTKQNAQGSLDNLKAVMDERADLHRSKKRIEERIKDLDEVLRPTLVGRGEVVHNGYSFRVDQVPGRKTVDYKRMAEDYGIDMDAYTKVGAPSSRFVIKPVQEI